MDDLKRGDVLHKMENGQHQHKPLLHTNSSLASCILVQLSDCVINYLGFTVYVQHGITKAYMLKACPLLRGGGGVGGGASHLPDSLIYKKSPANCCL